MVPYWGADGTPANLPRSTNLSASWSAWPIVEKTSFARLEQQLGNGRSVKGNISHAVRDTDGSVWYGAAGNPRADGTGVAYISHFNEHSTMDVRRQRRRRSSCSVASTNWCSAWASRCARASRKAWTSTTTMPMPWCRTGATGPAICLVLPVTRLQAVFAE